MKNGFTIITLITLLSLSGLFYSAHGKHKNNNELFHFNGRMGQWLMVDSKKKLGQLMEIYGTTINDIKKVNGREIRYGKFIFIPISNTLLEEDYIYKEKSPHTGINEFIWPISRVERISSSFGIRWGHFHTGIDMPRAKGTPIVAAMDGRVVYTGYSGGHGNTIYLEHRKKLYSRYSHISVMLVKKGELVKKGQIIALVGSTGNSTGNHLHFEIRYNDIPLNPLDFLPPKNNMKRFHRFRRFK
ncbi:M23 family metallopeptidase [Spirochaetota bacterium]